MSSGLDTPLWECPECGAMFVNQNQWHSCGKATLDDWLERVGPDGIALFERFRDEVVGWVRAGYELMGMQGRPRARRKER